MSQHYAADPTAIEHNGRLYVYCSNDQENTNNSGYIMDSIVCFSTDDLKNWTDHGVVFDSDAVSWIGTAWAPCIVRNHDRFYLYFGDAYWGIGVVTSASPTGPFTDPKGGLVVKREGLAGGTPGANSTWLFDPSVFVDDDGQPYLYFGGGGSDQARVIRLSTNMVDTIGAAMPIEFSDFFEAALMHKRNGTYYLSYADNYSDSTPSSQIAYRTSSNPTNGFVYQGVALGQPPNNFGNNNHHTFFTYQGLWYCVYHNRYQATVDGVSTTEHRNICLDRVNYNANGTIQQVTVTSDGLPQLKHLDPFNRVEGETLAQQSGTRTEVCSEGGMNLTSITNGGWIRIRGVDFGSGATGFNARVASAGSGGSIELRLDSLAGTLIGTCAVAPTGGWQNWTTASCDIGGVSGVHDLYLKFTGGAGKLFNLNWWQFQAGTPSGPALAHRYSFSETNGTTAADSIGGPGWNGTLPNGGSFAGGQLILSSNSQQYVNLPAGILSGLDAVTIEAWATFPASLPWPTWLFGFGNVSGTVGANYLFCSPGGGRFAVAGVSPGYLGETNAYTPGLDWSGKTLHLTCVFNPLAGYIAISTNGVVAGTNSSGAYTMSSIVNNYSWINRSLYSNDPYVNLTLNEFRIYSGGLSAAEIAATEALGPDQVLSTATPTVNITATPTEITLTWPLANAGFTPQSRTSLVDGSWMSVTSPAPQIVGDEWSVTLPRSGDGDSTFYRLSR